MSRILLADRLEVVRIGLKALLQSLPDVVVCGEAGDGIEAIEKAQQTEPDIIIMDPWMPGANGAIATQRIIKHNARHKVLIFGVVESEPAIRNLLRAGIQGLVSKSDPACHIVSAVEALQDSRMYFTARVEELILTAYLHSQGTIALERPRATHLSLREQEVIQILAEGGATKDVAATLHISCRTAATHRSNLMRKLRVHNVAELTLYAVSHHFVEAPAPDAPPPLEALGDVRNFMTRATQPTQPSSAKAAA
jgi:DNA-binding NarL/FixJ family response regulator